MCENHHSFDIARQGYVNLLLKKPDNLYEDKALFAARRAVYEAGFFDPMVEAVAALLPDGPVLDAGCGEGTLLHRLLTPRHSGIGLDIARPAIQMAAGAYKNAAWCVGDLCNLPLPGASISAILNILTPANYGEFTRILRPGGLLIKAVPGPDHLREIRSAVGKSPYAHSLDETMRVFTKSFAVDAERAIRYTIPCEPSLAGDVFTMTPMTTHDTAPETLPDAITVDLMLLVGKRRP